MKRILLSIVVMGVLLVSGCGAPTAMESPEQIPSPIEALPEEAATEEPVAEEEATEEEAAEEEATEEEATQPEPTPARFVATNLQVISAPEVSETSYSVTVDVQNTGGLKGVYHLRCKVDDEEMEPVRVELNPGEKKTIVLTEAQTKISSLAVKYKNGEIGQKKHVISVTALLSKTVTFPEPAYKLQLIRACGTQWSNGDEKIVVDGEVKNISDESLSHVKALVELYTNDGKLLKTASKLIDRNPIAPGQTSGFGVTVHAYLRDVARYKLFFIFSSGDTIPTDRSEQKPCVR